MSFLIGYDAEVGLDNQGYFIKPGSYTVKQPRMREAKYRADGSLSYVDLGPGKREFKMTILARNELSKFDGGQVSLTGQQYRDALRTSYTSHIATTIAFVDPTNTTINVYFDHYSETIMDLKSQIIAASTGGAVAPSYEVEIILLEA